MEDVKEEIRSRLPVEDVVGQYIELKRSGRNLKGRSPWGVDKTPSFMVSPDKNIWHDFSANKGGDIFTFIMEVEGISFREALEKLAAQAGVELKKYSKNDEMQAKRKTRAKEINELACKFYQVAMTKNKAAINYIFYKRNMNRKTVKEFRVGYAPNSGMALVEFLKKKGYEIREMRDAGVLTQYDRDLFRGRMMVPFIDTNGQVIGFTARILDKGEPKYLNTPETFLFNKSRYIFGFYQAKEAIRQEGFIVIVEGNMDVISSHQAGVKQAVATSGTAMTEYQLKALARLSNDIRLAYDGDEAGIRATERAINLAGGLGINLSVISDYHGAKDPDELIQKSPELWQEAVSNFRPAVDWLLDKYEEKLDITSGQGKREYSDVAMRLISYLEDPVEKKHYAKKVAKILDVSVEDLLAKNVTEISRVRRLKTVKSETKSDFEVRVLKGIEDDLLAIMVYGGEAGAKIPLEIPEEEAKLDELAVIFENRYDGWTQEALKKEAKDLMARRKDELGRLKVEELTGELAKYEEMDDEESIAKQQEILREIAKLKKVEKKR